MIKPLHLLAFERQPTLKAGGQERSLFEVVSGLRERGVAITLAYQFEGELLDNYAAAGVGVLKIPARRLALKSARAPISIGEFLASLGHLLIRHRTMDVRWDLIYVNQYTDLPLAALLGRIIRLPVVCHLRLPAHPGLGRQDRWGLMEARRLIAISHDTKRSYVRVGVPGDKIDVIHNAIDTSRYVPLPQAMRRKEKRVVYIGRISPEKGVAVLIDAFHAVRACNTDVSLHIYGDDRAGTDPGHHFEKLRRAAGSLVGEAITFHGHVVDIVSAIQSADVIVVPSTWDEAFGRVVIEAMSCAIPVVASRVGGIPEILEPDLSQLLVVPGDSAELAKKICEIVRWRETAPDLGQQCRNVVVARFDKARLIDSLLTLFSNVVSGSGDRESSEA